MVRSEGSEGERYDRGIADAVGRCVREAREGKGDREVSNEVIGSDV